MEKSPVNKTAQYVKDLFAKGDKSPKSVRSVASAQPNAEVIRLRKEMADSELRLQSKEQEVSRLEAELN